MVQKELLLFLLRFLFLPGIIIQTLALHAQQLPGCDEFNYQDSLYAAVKTQTLTYGENFTQAGVFTELQMDVYEPVGDDSEYRPGILFAFGGGFVSGTREEVGDLCLAFAHRGYVSFAIDYRLYDVFGIPDSLQILETLLGARSDMLAAVKYLQHNIQNENTFRLDGDKLFVGGVSAGAITALHAACLDPGDSIAPWMQSVFDNTGSFEGNSWLPEAENAPVKIAGVFNLLGAIADPLWIDEKVPPIISIHGTADDVVPYEAGVISLDLGPISIPLIRLYGSRVIHDRMDQLLTSNHLITVPGGGHGEFLTDESIWLDSLTRTVTLSFHDWVLCPESSMQKNDRISFWEIFPVPANDHIRLKGSNPDQAMEFEIRTFSGQLMCKGRNDISGKFILPDLPDGMYILRMADETGKHVLTQKLPVFKPH